jgi:mono/diheme cytochrome c family protein
MKKIFKISVLFVFLTTGIFILITRSGSATSAATITFSNISSSRSLYANNCARCHGADGKGNTTLGNLYGASDLTSRKVQKMSRKSMTRAIKNGVSGMPSFGKKLSDKDIYSLVNHVRSLN